MGRAEQRLGLAVMDDGMGWASRSGARRSVHRWRGWMLGKDCSWVDGGVAMMMGLMDGERKALGHVWSGDCGRGSVHGP